MPVVYLDTSALGRVLLGEPERAAILRALGDFSVLTASRLTRLELRRLGFRRGLLAEADQLLAGVALVPIAEELLQASETVEPPTVATLDAVHLTTALSLHGHSRLDAVLTYDRQLQDGLRHHDLRVLAPS